MRPDDVPGTDLSVDARRGRRPRCSFLGKLVVATILTCTALSSQSGSASSTFSVVISLSPAGDDTGGGGGLPGGGGGVAPIVPIRAISGAALLAANMCTSEAQSLKSGILVWVLCSSGQFVTIEPLAGRSFAGTYENPYRSNLGLDGSVLPDWVRQTTIRPPRMGSVTALRLAPHKQLESPHQMLVSF